MSAPVLKTLSVLRMAFGASTLLLPRHVGSLFGVPMIPEASILGRLFGVRDFILGAYLWKTVAEWNADRTKETGRKRGGVREHLIPPVAGSPQGNLSDTSANAVKTNAIPRFADLDSEESMPVSAVRHNNLTAALWLGACCDAVDIVSSGVCVLEGSITDMALLGVGGGAAIFTAAGLWQLMVLRKRPQEDSCQ